MNEVFADSSYFIALISVRDEAHESATAFATKFSGLIITSEYVLLEVANYFCSAKSRSSFVRLHASLSRDRATQVIPASPEFWKSGIELFSQWPDKDWSLTDCISFCMMTSRGLTHALATDRHFEQAGFIKLLGVNGNT